METIKHNTIKTFNPEVTKNINNLITVVDALSIPGASGVLKGISSIISFFEEKPDPVKELSDKLDYTNDLLENQYSIMLAAMEVWHLHTTIDDLKMSFLELYIELRKDSRLYSGEFNFRYDDIYKLIKLMQRQALVALLEGKRLINEYEEATKNDSGHLSDYIGGYVSCMHLPYQCVALAQSAYNLLVNHIGNLDDQGCDLETIDEELVYECNRFSEVLIKKTISFFEEDVPKSYPKWCRPIFKVEPMYIRTSTNNDKGDKMRLYCKGSLFTGIAPLSSTDDTTRIFKFEMVEKEERVNSSMCWRMYTMEASNAKEIPLCINDSITKKQEPDDHGCSVHKGKEIEETEGGLIAPPSEVETQYVFGIDYYKRTITVNCRKNYPSHVLHYSEKWKDRPIVVCWDAEKFTKSYKWVIKEL